MATWYFDSVNGSDSNNGTSLSTPKQNYHAFSIGAAANGDTFLFKRGTTQVISTIYTQARSGSSDAMRSRYAVYGESDVNYCTWTNPQGLGGMVLNMAGRSYVDVEDLRFNGGGVNINGVYANAQTASVTGLRFYRCHFYNATGSGLNVGIQGNATGKVSSITLEDCEAYDNGVHGVILIACNGATVTRCKFYRNGATGSHGGHGFSAGYAKRENITSGWTNTTGTIWQYPLAPNESDVYYVRSKVGIYTRVRRTLGTQVSPGIGEFGVAGGILYINLNSGTNPNSQGIWYGWGRCHNLWVQDCEAYENVWNRAAGFHEGHGFAFDDFADESHFLRNKSYNNQGAGFSINRGDRNRIMGNIAYGNWQSAVATSPTDGTIIQNNTFFNNNTGLESHSGEVSFTGYCRDAVISNNIIISTTAYAVSSEPTNTGFTGTNNNLTGAITAAEKIPALTGTVGVNPQLDGDCRPRAGEVIRAGLYLGGKDLYGKQFYNPPNIGAVEDITKTPRYLFYR